MITLEEHLRQARRRMWVGLIVIVTCGVLALWLNTWWDSWIPLICFAFVVIGSLVCQAIGDRRSRRRVVW